MALLATAVTAALSTATVLLLTRATIRLLEAPDERHDALVPTWERRVTTAVGLPCLLVGLSTMVGGPLAVPFPPLSLTLFGAVATVYPNVTPSSLG